MIELKKEYRAAKLKEFKESLKGIEYSSLCVLSGFMKDQIKIISNEKNTEIQKSQETQSIQININLAP